MKRFIRSVLIRFQKVPVLARVGGGIAVLGLLYVWTFVVPVNVQFSYADNNTCTDVFTVAPDMQKQRGGEGEFKVTLEDKVHVFGVPVFSRSACVSTVSAPTVGHTNVGVAPFGLPLFSKTIDITTPSVPVASVKSLMNAEISAVTPLVIPLSQKDAVHSYTIQANDKTAPCDADSKGVACDVRQLGLLPDAPYELALFRAYGEETPNQLEKIPVKTLKAIQLVDSTLKADMVVYDAPTEYRFNFDHELDAVDAKLTQSDGKSVDASFTVDGKSVVFTPKKALPRSAGYRLVISQVTGDEGGSLAAPITVPFVMSGGPKVANVSVGGALVPQNIQIIITFDQPLAESIDLAKFARTAGVGGSVSRASKDSIAVTIASAPLCAPFSITIDKGLPSGSNSEISAEPWKFDSRIVCGYSSVIGYSVKGRPIIAYTFGTGGTNILFTGGMHGSEPSGTSTMQAWVTYLQSNGYKIPGDRKIVVVPNTNPDGIAAGSRNNANNVNIDRNFPASNWRPDIDTASGTLPTGGGTSPASEPETKALASLTRQLRPRLEVSFHAQGRLVGANQLGDSVAIGKMYANMVGYGTMIGNAEEVMGYSITGEYEDWMGQELGTPAILIELPTHIGNYFNSHVNALLKMMTI